MKLTIELKPEHLPKILNALMDTGAGLTFHLPEVPKSPTETESTPKSIPNQLTPRSCGHVPVGLCTDCRVREESQQRIGSKSGLIGNNPGCILR